MLAQPQRKRNLSYNWLAEKIQVATEFNQNSIHHRLALPINKSHPDVLFALGRNNAGRAKVVGQLKASSGADLRLPASNQTDQRQPIGIVDRAQMRASFGMDEWIRRRLASNLGKGALNSPARRVSPARRNGHTGEPNGCANGQKSILLGRRVFSKLLSYGYNLAS